MIFLKTGISSKSMAKMVELFTQCISRMLDCIPVLLFQVCQYNWFWLLESRRSKGLHFWTWPRAIFMLIPFFFTYTEAICWKQQSPEEWPWITT